MSPLAGPQWKRRQQKFAEQNRPNTPPERLSRAIAVVPMEGQEGAGIWSLGFKELGTAVPRTSSLAHDFQAASGLVAPSLPCYLLLFVGDIHSGAVPPGATDPHSRWVLVSFAPQSCSAEVAKLVAANREGLKAGLGADYFVGDMWCTAREQISLSFYIRQSDAAKASKAR
jgi:hypothetical protein